MKRYLHSGRKLHLLLENSKEIIIFFQRSGKIIECNKTARKILGYGDDIYDINIADIFKKAVKIQNNSLIINPRYRNNSHATIAYKKNQTCLSVELKIVIINNFKGSIGLCIATDISEKKKLNSTINYLKNEINNLNQIKNKFVANITHELKTPLNGIMGMIETLKDMELTPDQKESIDIIYKCCKNMNSLISDLLDITRMKCNMLVLEERKFHFRQMIDNIIKLYKRQANEKNLKLIVNVSKDIPEYLIGDEYRLTQIINNLLSNAIKFTFEGQVILDVTMTEYGNNEVELFFMVIDTGIGISAEEKDKLFISFYQVDGSITRRFGGFGLGLSICQMLVNAMGGKITVESEPGKGSTFSFEVKLKVAEVEDKEDIRMFNDEVIEDYSHQDKEYMDILLNDMDKPYSYENKLMDFSEELKFMMEKLIISIEMKVWENAEQLALVIREMLSKRDRELAKKALQLLLRIRKEDYDVSLQRAKELMYIISEVDE